MEPNTTGEPGRSPTRFPGRAYPQRVPTPPFSRPGGLAPWSRVPAARRRPIALAGVVEAVAAHPASRDFDVVPDGDPADGGERSAVLVALFEVEGDTRVVLTRRSMGLRAHRGEVALPGGRGEPGESAWATALREAHEEVGLDPARVAPVGRLTGLSTIAARSAIVPVVGALDAEPALTPAPGEVDRAFSASLSDLAADGAFLEERWWREEPRPRFYAHADGSVAIQFFYAEGELVWGATARVLTELVALALGVETPRH